MCYSVMVRREIKALERRFGPLVVRDSELAHYEELHKTHPKAFPKIAGRIYSGHFAPVVFKGPEGDLHMEYMRYSAFPPGYVREKSALSTFNARRDNLRSPFWKECFGRGHGVILLAGFFEWVAVSDLLGAGRVTLAQVVAEFERQKEERRRKLEAAGKAYKPTKTELTDPRFRKTVIQFTAEADHDLVAPVIFNEGVLEGERVKGFAIVTDEPFPEVAAAGHDRSPILLPDSVWPEWLVPKGKTPRELDAILGTKEHPLFTHALDAAA